MLQDHSTMFVERFYPQTPSASEHQESHLPESGAPGGRSRGHDSCQGERKEETFEVLTWESWCSAPNQPRQAKHVIAVIYIFSYFLYQQIFNVGVGVLNYYWGLPHWSSLLVARLCDQCSRNTDLRCYLYEKRHKFTARLLELILGVSEGAASLIFHQQSVEGTF